MPELPEVETVRRGLCRQLGKEPRIRSVELIRADLRVKVPKRIVSLLAGETVLNIRRRAKYLLFDTEKTTLISHLGMSGSWRFADAADLRKHDHFFINFENGLRLVFHDPRRFGLLDFVPRGQEDSSRWLRSLGVEPLAADFRPEYLKWQARGKKSPVKNFIMDQKVLVGVGNIYASEALFHAGIQPLRKTHRIKDQEWQQLVAAIRLTLRKAIQYGGTTLRDYVQASGKKGSFQRELFVYDREGEPCLSCKSPIRMKVVAGRSTYWCGDCQK